MAHKVILDCDPGHDDALAIVYAWARDDVELLGITTVVGNQTLDKVTRNALSVATVAGIQNVPIAAGAATPLVQDSVVLGEHIHGDSGLDGPELPEPTVELDPRPAWDLIADLVKANPGEVTLVPTGTLTNIALFVCLYPDLVSQVKEVILMGGAHSTGNMTPSAEFNIYCDPEAADVVFRAAWPVTMVGLDVTHKALATDDVLAALHAQANPVSTFIAKAMEFFGQAYKQEQCFPAPPVHDPCAMVRLTNPEIVRVIQAPVRIDLDSGSTRGKTVVDTRSTFEPGDPSKILATDDWSGSGEKMTGVAVDLDADAFWKVILDALGTYGS